MARIAVIGAGVIGLACALRLSEAGHAVTVIDPAPDGDKCSWGNAGGIAMTEVAPQAMPGIAWRVPGWLLDPLGPVALRPAHLPAMLPWLWRFVRAARPARMEAAAAALAGLLRPVADDVPALFDTIRQSGGLFRRGALTVYASAEALRRDAPGWALRRRHGIDCQEIGGAEARAMEPALGRSVGAAVFTPAWWHVADPKTVWQGLRDTLIARGAPIIAAPATSLARPGAVMTARGELACDAVVLAAGAWSATLAATAGARVPLESERGYNVTLPAPGVTLSREIIFAERHFVATPLAPGLRIGGAAEFAGLAAPPNHARAEALARLAEMALPGLDTRGGTAWMGQRPATPDSLPVLGPLPARPDVVCAFGHGHLGLTLAATTARLVAAHFAGERPDWAACAPGRF